MGSLSAPGRVTAAAVVLLLVAGCGSTARGSGAGVARAPEAPPPPLPAKAADAVPADAAEVVHLDLGELRSSPELRVATGWFDQLRCLRAGGGLAHLEAVRRLSVVMWPDGDLALFLEGDPGGQAPAPRSLLAAWMHPQGVTPEPPRYTRQGRHRRFDAGGWSSVALGGKLVLLGAHARVRALLAGYDDPRRAAADGFWQAQPDGFGPGANRVLSWHTASLDTRLADRLGTVAGRQVAGAMTGAPIRAVVSRAPLEARLEAELRSAQSARVVVDTLDARLRKASLILRLVGLPLDKRLQTAHKGAKLTVTLAVADEEARRLMKLAEPALPDAAVRVCEALAHMGTSE